MKVFEIKKGTKVILSNDDGKETKNIHSKCDATFCIEEIIIDPVKSFNSINMLSGEKKLEEEKKRNNVEHMLQMFGGGFFKFKLSKGVNTNTKYEYLYVKSDDVNTI